MRSLKVIGLLEVLFLSIGLNLAQKVEKSYCEGSYFNAQCEDGVILMRSAHYGRMKEGTCISANYFIGCSANVRPYFDRQCSGRKSCSIYISDPELHKQKPCDKELVMYLEASYECISASTASIDECDRYGELPLRPSSGYLSSDVTVQQNSIGTEACPWIIKVPKGQKIQLTLVQFGKGKMTVVNKITEEAAKPSDSCYELGIITEVREQTRFSQCGMGSNREHTLYQSSTNRIEVSLQPGTILSSLWPFLIKYEATGCPHLKPPKGAYIEGDTENAVVRCNTSGETWYLTCGEKGWIGDVGNCTKVIKPSTSNGSNFLNMGGGDFPIGILLIVALGVALGVFLGGILLTVAAVHMKKKQRKNREKEHTDDLYNTFQRCPMQENTDKINLSHQPYYDIDHFTLQGGDYGLHSDCPTHGHKHNRTLPAPVMNAADLITSHQHEPDVNNQQYEPTMPNNNITRHGHMYEKTQQQMGNRIGT